MIITFVEMFFTGLILIILGYGIVFGTLAGFRWSNWCTNLCAHLAYIAPVAVWSGIILGSIGAIGWVAKHLPTIHIEIQ